MAQREYRHVSLSVATGVTMSAMLCCDGGAYECQLYDLDLAVASSSIGGIVGEIEHALKVCYHVAADYGEQPFARFKLAEFPYKDLWDACGPCVATLYLSLDANIVEALAACLKDVLNKTGEEMADNLTRIALADLDDAVLARSLVQTGLCPACGGNKGERHTFCGYCYRDLSHEQRMRIYDRIGKGYKEAVVVAMTALGKTEFLVPAPAEPGLFAKGSS